MIEQEMAQRNLIFKAEVGSTLYGTVTESSDKDYLGIFVPDKSYVLGTKVCEEVQIRTNPSDSKKRNSAGDVDTVLYSLPKFIKLLQNNNPNIMEMLWIPKKNQLVCAKWGQLILDSASLFVSKKAKHTFLGYAFGQKKLLFTKRDRYKHLQETLNLVQDISQDTLPQDISVLSEVNEEGYWLKFNKGFKTKEVQARLEQELEAYGGRVPGIVKFGFDTKHASHLVRLVEEGLQLLVEGGLTFPLPQNNLIRDIKLGKVPLDEVIKLAETKERLVEEAYIRSALPNTPDLEAINSMQVKILEGFWNEI